MTIKQYVVELIRWYCPHTAATFKELIQKKRLLTFVVGEKYTLLKSYPLTKRLQTPTFMSSLIKNGAAFPASVWGRPKPHCSSGYMWFYAVAKVSRNAVLLKEFLPVRLMGCFCKEDFTFRLEKETSCSAEECIPSFRYIIVALSQSQN